MKAVCPRGSLIPSFRRNSTVSACLRKQQSLLLSLTHILLHSHSIFLDLEALFLYRHHILLFPREVCVHFINENELNSILTIWGIFHYAAREARRWPESRVRKPGSPLLPLCCFTLCGAFVTVEGTWSQVGGGLEGKPIVVTRGRNLFLYPSWSWKQLRRPGRQVLSGGTPSSQAVPAFREECVQEGQQCPDGTADGLLGSDSNSPAKGEKGSSFPRRRVAELFRRWCCLHSLPRGGCRLPWALTSTGCPVLRKASVFKTRKLELTWVGFPRTTLLCTWQGRNVTLAPRHAAFPRMGLERGTQRGHGRTRHVGVTC